MKRARPPALNTAFNPQDVAAKHVRDAGFSEVHMLHRGGAGFVFKASRQGEEPVAVKVCASPATKDHVMRELCLATTHPKLAACEDLVCPRQLESLDSGYAMPLWDMSLQELVIRRNGRQMLVAEVACILKSVCRAVHALHDSGLVHRDIKMLNVVVKVSDRQSLDLRKVALTDLGSVREEGMRITATGRGCRGDGTTVCCRPPDEVWPLFTAVSRGCDVFSTALMLLELVRGMPLVPPQTPMLRRRELETKALRLMCCGCSEETLAAIACRLADAGLEVPTALLTALGQPPEAPSILDQMASCNAFDEGFQSLFRRSLCLVERCFENITAFRNGAVLCLNRHTDCCNAPVPEGKARSWEQVCEDAASTWGHRVPRQALWFIAFAFAPENTQCTLLRVWLRVHMCFKTSLPFRRAARQLLSGEAAWCETLKCGLEGLNKEQMRMNGSEFARKCMGLPCNLTKFKNRWVPEVPNVFQPATSQEVSRPFTSPVCRGLEEVRQGDLIVMTTPTNGWMGLGREGERGIVGQRGKKYCAVRSKME